MAARTPSGPSSGLPDPDLSLKKRARRRIIGAVALALSAAIVLPLVLDSEPRQVRSDIQIRIPSRDTPVSERADGSDKSAAQKSDAGSAAAALLAPADRQEDKPETAPAALAAAPSAALVGPAAAPAPVSKASASDTPKAKSEPKSEPKSDRKAEPKPEPKPAARTEPKSEPKAPAKSEPKPESKAPPKSDTKPVVKPEPKPDPKPAVKPETKAESSSAAFQLQVGAFASEKAALDQVERVRRLGAKAYTERIKTEQGDRYRVRVGPYPGRDAAEQARGKLRAAGVDVSLVGP